MSLISIRNSFESCEPLLYDVCRNISFDRLIKGQTLHFQKITFYIELLYFLYINFSNYETTYH